MGHKTLAYACALIGFFFLAYKTLDGLYRQELKYHYFTELCQQNPKAFVFLTRKAYKLETDERLVDHVKLKHEWAKYPFGHFFDLVRDQYLKDGGSWYRRLNRFKVLKYDRFLKDAKNIDLSKYRSYHEFQN